MKYSWIHAQGVNVFPLSPPGFYVIQGYSVAGSQPRQLRPSNGLAPLSVTFYLLSLAFSLLKLLR